MSTANDMVKWMHVLLNGGIINGTKVIDNDVILKTWSQANTVEDTNDIQKPK